MTVRTRRFQSSRRGQVSGSVLNGPRLLESIPSKDNGFHHVPEKSLPPVPDQGTSQRKSDVRDISAIHTQTAQESEEIKELRRELHELQKRCEAQSRDLQSSNSFLNTADKFSNSDVIRTLQRLNAESQLHSTYMADCLAEDFKFRNVTANELASSARRFSKRIGHALVDALGVGTPEDIPMLLQIAFQAYLASELCQTISSWTLRSHNNTFIAGVYESNLRRCLDTGVCLRAATSMINHITHPESLIERIIKDLSDILLIAGCTAPPSDIISKITSRFRERIVILLELAGRLKKIFDDVILSDYDVFIVQPGEKFVDSTMEDADDDQVVVEKGQVACATHLGLSEQVPMGTLWDQGKKERVTVLKAEVLLESFFTGELDLRDVSAIQTTRESEEIKVFNDDARFPSASTSRDNTGIQQHWDADDGVKKELDVSDTQLAREKVKTAWLQEQLENKDRIITAQNAEIKEWEVKYTAQTEDFVTTRNDLEPLRRDTIRDQRRHAVESEKLTAEVEEWKRKDAAKAKELKAAHQGLEQLRSDLVASAAQIADVRRRHATESAELTSKLEELNA